MQTDLVQQYESLWENNAPTEQIADFCRNVIKQNDANTLLQTLESSFCWGEMVFLPAFLQHLKDDDDIFLNTLRQLYISPNNRNMTSANTARILAAKTLVPDKIRAFFWCVTMKYYRWPYNGLIDKAYADIHLADLPFIRSSIIFHKTPGYERIPPGLSFMSGKHVKLSRILLDTIFADSISLFKMNLTLSGQKITLSILRELINRNAFKILASLLKTHCKAITDILSPQDLLICLCTLNNKTGNIPNCIHILEKQYPGICKSTDALGNTPLWYCLQSLFDPCKCQQPIIQALIHYGCNPDQKNLLGLNYSLCYEMSEKLKQQETDKRADTYFNKFM